MIDIVLDHWSMPKHVFPLVCGAQYKLTYIAEYPNVFESRTETGSKAKASLDSDWMKGN